MPISKIKTSSITADAASINLNIDANTLFLDVANNRVGINYTSPSSSLFVSGSTNDQQLRVGNAASAGNTQFLSIYASNAESFYNSTNTQNGIYGSHIWNATNNAGTVERMRIDASGNLGINNTSPSTFGKVVVQVAGTATPTTATNVGPSSINLYNAGSGGSTNSTVGIFGWQGGNPGIGSGIGFTRESDQNWGSQIRFYTHPTDTTNIGTITERVRIDSAGSVGIGTTSPQDMLDVAGNARVGQGQVSSNATVGTLGIYSGMTYNTGNAQLKFFGKSVDNTGLTYELGRISSGSIGSAYTIGGGLIFSTASNNGANVMTLSPRMYITATGEVGIGTNAPASLLDVTVNSDTAYTAANTLVSGQTARISNLSTTAGVATTLMFNPKGGGGGNGLATISGVNTATASAAITFGTRDAGSNVMERVRILSSGVLKSGINSAQSTSEGGVASWNTAGFTNNNSVITFDITVPDDGGTGCGHHVEANHTHIDWTNYGAFLDAWYSTRGTSMSETRTTLNISSGNGGGWSVSKPNSTTLRVTKSAGSYPGGGYYWIKVTTVSTI